MVSAHGRVMRHALRSFALLSSLLAACAATPADEQVGPRGGGKADGAGCPVDGDGDAILQAIENAGSCGNAADLAEACAWGSSIDVQFVGAASTLCTENFAQMSPEETVTYDALIERCQAKYADAQGTMYRSMTAYCELEVMKLYNQYYPETTYSDPQVSVEHTCPVELDIDKIQGAIGESSSCYSAVSLAQDCAFGSSADVSIVGAAMDRCAAETGPLSDADAALEQSLHEACGKVAPEEEGTLGLSIRAHCSLQVSALFNTLLASVEE